ncbi:MAG: aldo/keto reductase [bacterium]|nr:aldo/keto reductase [bacterium]
MGTSYDRNLGMDRRGFLRAGTLAGAGLLATSTRAATPSDTEPARVRAQRALGKTGLRVSDVSFGGSRLREGQEDVVRHALDRGITYFDTAESYGDGVSERVVGKGLGGRRNDVIVGSKVTAAATGRKAEFMQALEGSLRRLGTDRIDLYFNHAVNDVARMQNPEWQAFVADAKQQGKIRFAGMSGHAGNLVECLDWALDHDRVDVILVAHNFGQDPAFYQRLLRDFDTIAVQPELPRVLAKAHARGVGTLAMKTLMGARLNDMRPYETGGATFAQAAFRWVLAGANVDAVVVSMTGREQIDEYLGASGATALRQGDLPLLARYAGARRDDWCRHGCGLCETSCPQGVPIGEVLRTRMYARDYGDADFARREYALLGAGAAACLSCAARPCAGACPHGLAPEVLAGATHRLLA